MEAKSGTGKIWDGKIWDGKIWDTHRLVKKSKKSRTPTNWVERPGDEAGNKTTQTDVEGRITRWSYDALGRVTSRTLPLGQTESFVYDNTGNEISHTDFNGHVTTKTYYPLNDRLHTVTYHDGTSEAYTYTVSGQVETITQTDISGSRLTSNVYDLRDRLQQQTQPDGSVLNYQYDANGNRTQVSVTRDNATFVTYYVYDALNRLTQVTDADGNITTYTYDAAGNRESETKANGNKVGYVYDERNRLTELTHRAADNSVLQQFSYTLHPTGRRLQIDEASGRSTVYGYGYLYYLESETITDAQNGNYSASYAYDGVGNRLEETINGVTTTYTVDANDRLTQKGSTTYTYDNNGNTLTETDGSTVALYAYNAKNELVSVTKNGTTTDFLYNASGIRTGKVTGSATTSFVVDENRDYAQVLLEASGSDAVRYTYGDDLVSQTVGGVERYFHYDGLGSTRALSDEAGTVSDTYDYGAFGEEINSSGSTENKYRFTGEQYDSTLSQYYLRARYYNPAIGRFTKQDTYQGSNFDPVTLHKYIYANANPGNLIDPSGKFSLSEFGAAYTVRAVLTNAASGSVLGGIDAYLGGGSLTDIARGAGVGAATAATFGPLGYFEQLRRPLVTTFTALGFLGAADAASQGNYGQAAFRGISSALGAYLFLKTSIIPSQVDAPVLADGQVYSGVYYSRTGKIVLRPSSMERPVPNGFVSNRGGHGTIAADEFAGADPSELFGFTAFAEPNGVIRLEYLSRSVNGPNTSFPGNVVPEILHSNIGNVVGAATGRSLAN